MRGKGKGKVRVRVKVMGLLLAAILLDGTVQTHHQMQTRFRNYIGTATLWRKQ